MLTAVSFCADEVIVLIIVQDEMHNLCYCADLAPVNDDWTNLGLWFRTFGSVFRTSPDSAHIEKSQEGFRKLFESLFLVFDHLQ